MRKFLALDLPHVTGALSLADRLALKMVIRKPNVQGVFIP